MAFLCQSNLSGILVTHSLNLLDTFLCERWCSEVGGGLCSGCEEVVVSSSLIVLLGVRPFVQSLGATDKNR